MDDDFDVPADATECTDDVCVAGEPSNPLVTAGTACSDGVGWVCDGAGVCVECLQDADCTVPQTCGGGALIHTCGCTDDALATTCAGKCGTTSNNCGAVVDCGLGPGCPLWSKRFGGSLEIIRDIAVNAAGSTALVGAFAASIDFGGGGIASDGNDYFAASLDAAGGQIWSTVVGGQFGSGDRASVTLDPGGDIIVAGGYQGNIDFGGGGLVANGEDILVVKYDQAGGHLWSKSFGGALEQAANGIAVDSTGNVLVAGYFLGSVDFGAGLLYSDGGADLFLVKCDPSGNHVWSQRFGDATSDFNGQSVAFDSNGNVLVAGDLPGTLDFGGGQLVSAGATDVFLAKLDASGSHVWSKRFGDAGDQKAESVAVDAAGNVVVAGQFQGAIDFGGGALTDVGGHDIFVAKFDSAGNHLWSKRFGDGNLQTTTGIAIDPAGNVVLEAQFKGAVDFGGGALTGAGNTDILVAKLDPLGNHIWSKRFGDASSETAGSVGVDIAGDIFVSGHFSGTIDFGLGPLSGPGIFLAKLAP